MFRAIFQSSSITKSVAVAAAAVGLSVGVAEPLVAQTVLEITGERLPYFRRHGDFLDIAGVDSTIHPVVRTYDLAQVGQPLTNTASPYAANEFERGRVSVTNFSPSGSYLGVHGLGLEGAEEFTRFTSVVAAPNYDNPMVLPGIENLPTEARQATMVTDNGGAVGSLNRNGCRDLAERRKWPDDSWRRQRHGRTGRLFRGGWHFQWRGRGKFGVSPRHLVRSARRKPDGSPRCGPTRCD